MPWFLIAAAIAALTVVFVLLAPKPKIENARAGALDDLRFPQAKEGLPGGIALGTVRVRGPNTIWYGDFEAKPIKEKVKTGLFSSKKVIVGYEYYVGFDLSMCLGPLTRFKKIWIDKEILWEGLVSASGTLVNVNKPKLFGGKKYGGGFWGPLRFYLGTFTETVNSYLQGVIDDPLGVPAYNGWARIVFEKVCIGESPQLRPISVEVERFTNGLELAQPTIGDDLNPAELLYQVTTMEWGGLGASAADLDLDSFVESGNILADEQNGMSVLITSATQGKAVVEEVLRQIDGIMYQDPETSKLVLKLIRFDYDVLELPVLDETNVTAVRSFASTTWEETINQLRVNYTNRDNNYEPGVAMAKDMANINAQGRLKTAGAAYPGVTNGTLANEIAARELSQLCVPLFRAQLELTRMAASLRPGDPFIFSWDEYQIESVVMRVQKFNMGELLNGKLVVEAVQDQFATGLAVIGTPGSSGWTPIPPQPAEEATQRLIRESHYFFFQSAGEGTNLPDSKSGILVAAEAPGSALSAEVHVSTDSGGSYAMVEEEFGFTPIGVLQTAISATANLSTGVIPSITVSGFSEEDLPEYETAERNAGAGMFMIGGEYMLYEGVTDNGDGTFTLTNCWRALLDSAPQSHSISDKVYILSGDNFIDDSFPGTETLRVKLLTVTYDEAMELADAPYDTLTLKNRVFRPAAPANIKFDAGTAFVGPTNATGARSLTWANRNRKSETVRKITDSTSEYEEGQRTVVRWRKNAGAWTTTVHAPGVTGQVIDAGAGPGDTVDYELWSTRDGLDSFNKWTFSGVGGGSSGADGGGSSPDTGGSTPPDSTPTYSGDRAVQIVFPFGTSIGTDPMDIPITVALTVPRNFGDFAQHIRVNPVADATFTFRRIRGGVTTTVGTIVISTSGNVTASTTGGAEFEFEVDDIFSCSPPSPAVGGLAGVSFTIPAVTKKPE